MPTIITPDLDVTPQGTLVRIDQKIPELVNGKLPVDISGAGGSLTVTGRSGSPVTTFNRPANTTPYAAGDVIGSATTANHQALNVGLTGSLIQVQSASLIVNNTSVPSGMTSFRLHLWDTAPAAIADNAAFAAAAADRAKYAGFVDLPSIAALGGGFLFTSADYVGRPIRLDTTSIWFNLVTNGAFTPASGTEYRVRFHCVEVGV
jgi:hypothetical protein